MIIDGEKWACEACVRGHRVSNCQHADRPLQHINKKGRPVSQCQHCRSMRKSRSSHVKCDCGEKTHKCMHLKATVEGHRDTCCCNHGGRCTCAHKKEPQLDPVPESGSDKESTPNSKAASPKAAVRRRRANTTNSEGALSFDDRGHHKPTYKGSKASQKCGPYQQLTRVHSAHTTGSMSNRSADNLLRGESRSSRDSPVGSTLAQEQRQVRSETASPQLQGGASFGHLHSQLPPLDLSAIEYPPYAPNGFDLFSNMPDNDQGLFSAGLSATSVDWSHYDLEFNATRTAENFAPSNYSQPQSYGGFDYNGSEQAPTLATTTSGEVSEVDDVLGSSADDYEASAFGTSAPTRGYTLGDAQAGALARSDFGSHLDFDSVKFMRAANKFLPTPASLASDDLSMRAMSGSNNYSFVDDDPAVWMSDYHHGLPATHDSPEPGMMPFWDGQ